MAETAERLGTLYGIGAGPGDPELLTMKGFRLLRESPVIAYPKKRMGSRSYALDIVEAYVNPEEKTMLGLVFPMTRDPDDWIRLETTKALAVLEAAANQR
ncbi:MAG: hypothetical protein K6T81_14250 [Alicyclobacillus macrosporangiidus]|nr:hypothetical protein [Alicyclobacillus macrosporangiidus]